MPELPEVQTTVDGLRAKVLRRTFVDVWSDWKKTVKRPQGFEQFKKLLKGNEIVRVWRRAKN
ncbi:MAG: DNA-formamidopyrimidine glycosylase family protein, partial [Candidatus Saccharimonadales bacterium]